jgi:PAS domain S-box-containing protein
MLRPLNRPVTIVVLGRAGAVCSAVLHTIDRLGVGRGMWEGSAAAAALHQPDLLLVCGDEVVPLCQEARRHAALARVPILALVSSGRPGEIEGVLARGADDVLVDALDAAVLGVRLRGLLRGARQERALRRSQELQQALLAAVAQFADDGATPQALHQVLLLGAAALEFSDAELLALSGDELVSVSVGDEEGGSGAGPIAGEEYTELAQTIRARRAVQEHQSRRLPGGETAPCTRVVFPLVARDRLLGALVFRRRGAHELDATELAFGQLLAGHVALQLLEGGYLDGLREQTTRISRARHEAERRLRTIESLEGHFEAASDGVFVVDAEGKILFVNRAAEAITGFAHDGLLGRSLTSLVVEEQRRALREVVERVLCGTNIEAIDLGLSTTGGGLICVSVTTSTVASKHGLAVLSFRDVTAERVLESELRKTKEFLERLIDSTVDAIVAADTSGQIILFNSGAERLCGYRAQEVIGQMPLAGLFPHGLAQQVMRTLRSPASGGVGRLELTRREVLSKAGELVPVNMTASILYEDGVEVATVAILSDLRERIRIEQHLLQAQEKLELSEKHAVVAELAGTAAHELNQPLTSIMGYAQLLQRQIGPGAPQARAIAVILQEAERMAEIVKKIGRITRYETKEYVGSASILDLEKSAPVVAPDFAGPPEETQVRSGPAHPEGPLRQEAERDPGRAERAAKEPGPEDGRTGGGGGDGQRLA